MGARLPQRLEQTDLGCDGTRVLRPPETRPPKSLGVDVPNRLVIVGLLLPNDHLLILASHAAPRLGQRPLTRRDDSAGGQAVSASVRAWRGSS